MYHVITKALKVKQARLNRLHLQGSISREQLRESLSNYAKLLLNYYRG